MNTRIGRRTFLVGSSAIAAAGMLPNPASAQSFPSKPVELIVGASPGGGMDTYGRALSASLPPFLNNQPVLVVNRPGANTILAINYVTQSRPDGYTLNITSAGTVIIYGMWEGEGPNLATELKPVGTIGRYASCIVTRKDASYANMKEWVAAMKASDKTPVWAHTGHGSIHHIQGQALLDNVGIKATAIPYEGGSNTRQAVTIGEVDFAVFGTQNLAGFEDQVRALGILSDERSQFFPNVMTVFEQGVDAPLFYTPIIVHAPKDTPDGVVKLLEKAVADAANSKEYASLATNASLDVFYRSAADTQKWVETSMAEWGPIISKIKESSKS